MALIICVPLRAVFNLRDFITARHLDNIAKLMLVCALFVTYSYATEIFTAFYGADTFEVYTTTNRFVGPYAPLYFAVLTCNSLVPQALWSASVRGSPATLFVIGLVVLVGMWLERFMIIVTSLHRDFLPSAWGMFYPTIWDWGLLAGSVGAFMLLFLLFVRFLPAISMSEMRKLAAGDKP